MATFRFLSSGLLAGMLAITAGAAPATEKATIPYDKLDELWQKLAQADASKLVASAQILSKNPGVKPAQIKLVIRSAAGDIPLRVSAEGYIGDFPRTEELRKENPPIEANQPKGSLRLTIGVELAVPPTTTFSYARLVDGIAEAIKFMKAQAGGPTAVEPTVQAVIFLFPKSGARKATIEVGTTSGQRLLTADTAGQVKLLIKPTLAGENPQVTVSERPLHLFIDSE